MSQPRRKNTWSRRSTSLTEENKLKENFIPDYWLSRERLEEWLAERFPHEKVKITVSCVDLSMYHSNIMQIVSGQYRFCLPIKLNKVSIASIDLDRTPET
jgi:hypothetical protein